MLTVFFFFPPYLSPCLNSFFVFVFFASVSFRGKFGHVYRLSHKETGEVFAGKFYKGRRAKERDAAKKEIELMNSLHHPKLVQCLAAYDSKPEIVMVMEL